MKKIFLLLQIVIVSLMLSGCYESKVPLSSAKSATIDDNLLNYWVSIPKDKSDKKIYLAVFKINEHEHLVCWRDEMTDDTLITRGFITPIKGINIINIQNIQSLEEKERTYVFFKYGFTESGHLQAQILRYDHPLLDKKTFASSKKFFKYIKKNIQQDDLFDTPIEFKPAEKFDINIILPSKTVQKPAS